MPAVARMKKSPLAFVALLAASLTLLIWLLGQLSLLKRFEYPTLDWRFQLRAKFQPTQPDPHLILVGIDDESTAKLGSWPFSRRVHAQLLALLANEKPAVVAWDILFTDPRLDDPEQDELLVSQVKLFPRLITCASKDTSGRTNSELGPTQPLTHVTGDLTKVLQVPSAQLPFDFTEKDDGTKSPSLLRNSLFGFADSNADIDGNRRYLPMIVSFKGKAFASLSLKTVIEFCEANPDDVRINLGKNIIIPRREQPPLLIPINDRGELLVNYRRLSEHFENISYFGLYYLLYGKSNIEEVKSKDPDFEKKLNKELPPLAGNIVVIGFNGTGYDTGTTPFQQNSPMVVQQLNAISNILQQDFIYQAPTGLSLSLIFLVLLLLGLILVRVNLLLIAPLGLLTALAYFPLSYALFAYQKLWIPTALPMAGIIVATLLIIAKLYFGEESQKRQIKAMMAASIPEKVMQRLLEHPDQLKLGGTKRELSVLFCDIRGFTKYCDKREPEDVVGVLNEYMEVMSNVIFKYEGTIDKYIGDCIMAFWNAPEDQPDHAQRAVCCAMEMRYALANYKTQRAGIDSEIFECGIGIHTGPALVGFVGSTLRLSYTTIGATVNMAARLESLTKQFATRIIISDATRAQITTEDFTLTDLGQVSVPGFTQRVQLYAVEALQDISSALLVGKKVAHESNVSVADVENPMWKPAPLPHDAEVDAEGKG